MNLERCIVKIAPLMSQQPFTPPPLPPELDYISLLPALTQAHEAVARYDEAVSRLLNPLIVRHAFETQEAVRSSSIEGTQATLTDVLELDAGRTHEELSREGKDYQEIANYRRAISCGQELLASRPLAEVVIKELHRTVLDSARGMLTSHPCHPEHGWRASISLLTSCFDDANRITTLPRRRSR